MDSKKLKAKLKEAREAVNNKEYANVVQMCQEMLAIESEQYNALVFCAVAESQLGNIDMSRSFYQRATAADSKKPLAWMGVHKLYSDNDVLEKDLIFLQALDFLLSNSPSEEKKQDYLLDKLCVTAKLKDLTQFEKTLEMISPIDDGDTAARILTYFTGFDVLSSSLLHHSRDYLLVPCLQDVNAISKFLDKHADLAYTIEFFNKTSDWTHKVTNLQPYAMLTYALNVIIDGEPVVCCKDLPAEFVELMELIEEEDWEDAFDIIQEKGRPCDWRGMGSNVLSLLVLLTTRHYSSLLQVIEQLENVSTSNRFPLLTRCLQFNHKVTSKLAQYKMQASLHLGSTQSLVLAKTIYIDQAIDLTQSLCARYLIAIGDIPAAQKVIDDNKLVDEGLILHLAKGEVKTEDVHVWCEKVGDTSQGHLLIGQLRWAVGEKSAALVKDLLMSAKQDRWDWRALFYLGHYYMHKGEARAIRCYLQSWDVALQWGQLAPHLLEDIGLHVSRAYDSSKDQSLQHIQFLTQFISILPKCSWAYKQLSSLQLASNDVQGSIDSLRKLVNLTPQDVDVWLSLADAYFSRAAYESAGKAYAAVCNMENCSENTKLYVKYKLANIHLLMGKYVEALETCNNIKHVLCDSVPVLVLCAKVHFEYSDSLVQQSRLVAAGDHLLQSICLLERCLVDQESAQSCCSIWKLLGDCIHKLITTTPKSCRLKFTFHARFLQLIGGQTDWRAMQVCCRCYMKATECRTDLPELWLDVGVSLYNLALEDTNKREQWLQLAVQACRRSVTLDPKSTEPLCVLALVYLLMDQPAKCVHVISCVLEEHPRNVQCHLILGVLYIMNDNVTMGHKAVSMAQSIDPLLPQPWALMAVIAGIMGESEESTDLFRHSAMMSFLANPLESYAAHVVQSIKLGNHVDESVIYCIYDRLCLIQELYPENETLRDLLVTFSEIVGLNRKALAMSLTRINADGCGKHGVTNSVIRLAGKLGQYDTVRKYSSGIENDALSLCMKGVALARVGEICKAIETMHKALWAADQHNSTIIQTGIDLCSATLTSAEIPQSIQYCLLGQYFNGKLEVSSVICSLSKLISQANFGLVDKLVTFISLVWGSFQKADRSRLCAYLTHLFPFNKSCQRLVASQLGCNPTIREAFELPNIQCVDAKRTVVDFLHRFPYLVQV